MINQPDNTQCDVNSTGYCEKHGREYYKCQSNTQELDEIFDKMGYTNNTDFRKHATRLITDWHNKQVEEVLGKLLREYELDTQSKWFSSSGGMVDLASAIESERSKLQAKGENQ